VKLRAVVLAGCLGAAVALAVLAGAAAADERSGWWLAAVGADRIQPPGPGVPVTVIDSGIDLSNPLFAGRPRTTALDPQTTSGPEEAHGTEVASVVVGVYPQVDLRVWDATPAGGYSRATVVAGLQAAAARGRGVVNMSFGGFEHDPVIDRAIDIAFRSGVVVVAAAGNDRGSGSRTSYPAASAHVLTVGAVDAKGSTAGFSSAVPGLDLVAPGKDVPVALPTGSATADGTSFAAPIVAAAVAWVWTLRPELDATQVFELVRASARDLGARGYDADTGYGLLDVPRALALAAPPPDPGEPNEDVALVEGDPPLQAGVVRGRLDFTDDPEDVYPVALPPRSAVTVSLAAGGGASLELWRAGTRSVGEEGAARTRDLAGSGRSVTLVNDRPRAETVFADVFPAQGVRVARYALTVTAARARSRRAR
jgi:subtilisin family serine protease